MSNKSNIDFLRDTLNGMELEKTDEALEWADAVEEELIEMKDKISSQETEISDLQSKLEEANENLPTSIDLGLDTIHFRLEKGNLIIRQRLQAAFRLINTIPNREITVE